jgi:hypothetical protein
MNPALADVAAALCGAFLPTLTPGSKAHEDLHVAGLVGGGVGVWLHRLKCS